MEGNKNLTYEHNLPEAREGSRMLLSFSDSWNIDGISTIISNLVKEQLSAERVAGIGREGFYNTFFSRRNAHGEPKIWAGDGVLTRYSAGNDFYYAPNEGLLIFQGAEPDTSIDCYSDYLFEVAEKFKVKEMYFGGSCLNALLPPTREPGVVSFVSDEMLKGLLKSKGISLIQAMDYTCSIVEYLMYHSRFRNIKSATVLVAVPPTNIVFFPSALVLGATLEKLLGLDLDLSGLKDRAEELKRSMEEILREDIEMQERVTKLEEMYDWARKTYPTDPAEIRKFAQLVGGILDKPTDPRQNPFGE